MTQDIIKLSEIDFDQLKSDLIELSKELAKINPYKWQDIKDFNEPYYLVIEPTGYNQFDSQDEFCFIIKNDEFTSCFPLLMLLDIEGAIKELKEDYEKTFKKRESEKLEMEARNKAFNEDFLKKAINNNLEFAKEYIKSLEQNQKEQ